MLLCKNRRLFAVFGDNSHVLTHIPMHLIPIPIPFPSHASYSHSHGNPMGPMGSQSSPFPCTPLILLGTMPAARRRGRPRTAWVDNIKTWTGLPVEETVRMTGQILMEKVRPWCGQPSDRGRLKNRTVRFSQGSTFQAAAKLRRGFVVCLP